MPSMPELQQSIPNSFRHISFKRKTELFFVHTIGAPRFNEVDHYGVVWNGHFVNYFEIGRMKLCHEFGFGMHTLAEQGIYLPVYNYELTVRKSVLPGEVMEVAVRPKELTESKMLFEHLILVSNEVRASGTVTHISLEKETRSMCFVLPEKVKQLLCPLKEVFEKYGKLDH